MSNPMSGDLFQERGSAPADDRDAPAAPARRGPPVVPVSAFVAQARQVLERQVALSWIGGEVSGCSKAPSGHLYFRLKDAQAQVSCVMYRTRNQHLPFSLKDGMSVEVRATATLYEPRGEFQLNVDAIRLAGVGVLYERFARLKARLEAEGLFAASRKRALPAFPRTVGIVTSPRAAALRDVLTTLRRRWPALRVVIYPTPVQGMDAASEIARAIRAANARAEVDVLIVARGGGSIEDLWSFNEEVVARAVFESALPVVSGVGHETDFTICDFVADVRAPTPTAAATLVAPDRQALSAQLSRLFRGLDRAALHALQTREQRLDHAMRRLVHPAARVAQQHARVNELATRLGQAARAAAERRRVAFDAATRRLVRELRTPFPASQRVSALAQNLTHLNPESVLTRGYAIVATADGTIVSDAAQVSAGDRVGLTFARGGADATIVAKKTR
ncbi:MAG: exodeoxyribonuclease VII large subunit [Burkholderiales bacterium]